MHAWDVRVCVYKLRNHTRTYSNRELCDGTCARARLKVPVIIVKRAGYTRRKYIEKRGIKQKINK